MATSGNTQKVRKSMKSVFENIIEKLRINANNSERKEMETDYFEEEKEYKGQRIAFRDAIDIVNQEVEKYDNGWIPFSEQLPDYGESVLVSFNQARQPLIATFYGNDTWKMLQGVNGLIDITNEVIAWQPLPQPYQPKGE